MPLTLVTLRKKDFVKFESVKAVKLKVSPTLACMHPILISFQPPPAAHCRVDLLAPQWTLNTSNGSEGELEGLKGAPLFLPLKNLTAQSQILPMFQECFKNAMRAGSAVPGGLRSSGLVHC